MLQSRTVREGSVGLLALLGLGLFGAAAIWLGGLRFGQKSYQVVAEFPNVNGMRLGDKVRYRGLEVGRIVNIQPASNGVDVTLEIDSSQLVIPKKVKVSANRSGLIGEQSVDLTPLENLTSQAQPLDPVGDNCNKKLIVCNGDRLSGEPGVTLDDLLPLMARFSQLFADPQFFDNINSATRNASVAAVEVAKLSKEMTLLTQEAKKDLQAFSSTATSVNKLVNQASTQLASTGSKYNATAEEVTKLASNVNGLVDRNRDNLSLTLNNISDTSKSLRTLMANLNSTVDRVNDGFQKTDTAKLMQNLETLTANATVASSNLRNASKALNDPKNIVVIQKTLDSARATFENAQKITSDLDELTGDPSFRTNVKDLVDGLSQLVSSTEQLKQGVNTAKVLAPISVNLASVNLANKTHSDRTVSLQGNNTVEFFHNLSKQNLAISDYKDLKFSQKLSVPSVSSLSLSLNPKMISFQKLSQ